MAAGFLKIFPVHRGNAFTGSDGINYILLNGLSYARTAYPDLSLLWPSGAYGSDDTNMHMPDLTDLDVDNVVSLVFEAFGEKEGAQNAP